MKRRLVFILIGLAILAFPASLAGPALPASTPAHSGDSNQQAPGRSFLYTITNPDGPNGIAAYERNVETGELVFLDTYSNRRPREWQDCRFAEPVSARL